MKNTMLGTVRPSRHQTERLWALRILWRVKRGELDPGAVESVTAAGIVGLEEAVRIVTGKVLSNGRRRRDAMTRRLPGSFGMGKRR